MNHKLTIVHSDELDETIWVESLNTKDLAHDSYLMNIKNISHFFSVNDRASSGKIYVFIGQEFSQEELQSGKYKYIPNNWIHETINFSPGSKLVRRLSGKYMIALPQDIVVTNLSKLSKIDINI